MAFSINATIDAVLERQSRDKQDPLDSPAFHRCQLARAGWRSYYSDTAG